MEKWIAIIALASFVLILIATWVGIKEARRFNKHLRMKRDDPPRRRPRSLD